MCNYWKQRKMKLPKSLEESLKKDDLSNLAIDLGEVGIDAILEGGVLRDIPILSSIVSGKRYQCDW